MTWGATFLIVLPLAATVGGFAGWCLGATGGEWLEYVGAADATSWSGRVGGLLGAVLCPGYVAYRVLRDERTPSTTRDEAPR